MQSPIAELEALAQPTTDGGASGSADALKRRVFDNAPFGLCVLVRGQPQLVNLQFTHFWVRLSPTSPVQNPKSWHLAGPSCGRSCTALAAHHGTSQSARRPARCSMAAPIPARFPRCTQRLS